MLNSKSPRPTPAWSEDANVPSDASSAAALKAITLVSAAANETRSSLLSLIPISDSLALAPSQKNPPGWSGGFTGNESPNGSLGHRPQ
jgi:hypothetical protein